MNIAGWVIVIAHGRMFIGKPDATDRPGTPTELSPVFSLQSDVMLMQGPRGETGIQRPCIAMPVLGLPSIKRIDVPVDVITIAVDSLSDTDRKALEQAVQVGVEMCQQMKAAEAGIIQPGRVDGSNLVTGKFR